MKGRSTRYASSLLPKKAQIRQERPRTEPARPPQLGLDPDEFDVICAYPWPDQERVTEDLFEHYAAEGAVLLTYHGVDHLRIRRQLAAG